MTIVTQQKLTFDQFLDQYPEDGRYELVDGEIVEMRAIRWGSSGIMVINYSNQRSRLIA